MILTPVSALHSRKKGGLKRYEKIRAQRALSDDVSGISGHRDRPAASGNAGHQPQLAYDLINDGELQAIKIGNSFKIPKVSVINFVTEEKKEVKSSA